MQGNNNFSFKKGGKKMPGYGGGGQANIFAMAAAGQQRQDRGYYESLYHFDADVELAEYSLPVRTQQTFAGKKAMSQAASQRVTSGMINATHLPPIDGAPMDMDPEAAGMMEEMQYQMEMEGVDEYGQEMEDVGMEQEPEEDQDVGFGDLKGLFRADEMKGKDYIAETRKANFISKGSYIWNMLSQIETGEQAISFFAKYGQSTPIKFVKFKRKPVSPDQFRPYDLVKVDEDDDNPRSQETEYFTISAQGVVHVQLVQKKGSGIEQVPTEFMTLSQWMHQSTLFNVLTSMNFFKHYLIGKVFALWKGNVRFKMFNRTRQQLAKSLIQTRPAFLDSFIQVNKTLYDMKSKLTFWVPSQTKVFEIADFNSQQKTEREATKHHYSGCVDKIINEILSTLIKQITESRNFKEEEDMEGGFGKSLKNKSMNLMKQEKKLKQRVINLAERNYNDLGTFIRLVDYMVVEAQVSINQESVQMILSEMDKESRKYNIQTTVNFANDNDGMVFEPCQTDFITHTEKILTDMQAITEEVTRVIIHPEFHMFIHGLINDQGPRFRTIVEKSEAYHETKQAIIEHLAADFKYLTEMVDAFKECRMIHEFEKDFDFDRWKSENATLKPIREKLKELRSWEIILDTKIGRQPSRGFIQVQSKKLQLHLQKRVKIELKNIANYLFELAYEKQSQITKSLQQIKNDLDRQTGDLKAYVEFCSTHQSCKQLNTDLINEKRELDEMKQNLQRYKEKDDTALQQKIMQLQNTLELLGVELENNDLLIIKAGSQITEERNVNIEQLETRITDEQKKVQDLIENVNTSEILLRKDTKSKEALEEAKRIKKKFDDSQKRLQTYRSYQGTMGLGATPIPEEQEFLEKFKIRNDIWQIREDFSENCKVWYNHVFRDQDAEKIVETVTADNARLKRIKAKFPLEHEDEVLEQALEEVRKVMEHRNLISALGNTHLEVKHMDQIFGLLPDAHSGSMAQFNLQSLLDKGIDTHVERVEEISAAASGEANIKKTIQEVADQWAAIDFPVEGYRGMKDRYIIGKEVEEIIQILEDDQMTVGNCMGSRYVIDIVDFVADWEKKLSTIGFVIDEWLTFQKSWMYLENIFTAEDMQKALPKETKQFQMVDKFWKELMISVRKGPNVLDKAGS